MDSKNENLGPCAGKINDPIHLAISQYPENILQIEKSEKKVCYIAGNLCLAILL